MKKITIDNSDSFNLSQPNAISFDVDSLRGIKVVDAWLTAKVSTAATEPFASTVTFTSAAEPWIVDYIPDITNGLQVTINISDELQTALDLGLNKVELTLDGQRLGFDPASCQVQLQYLTPAEYQQNGSTNNINLKQAGIANIDLSTGNLTLATSLVASDNNPLPLSLSAKYNTHTHSIALNNGLPQHWNLNLSQFLVQNTNSDKLLFTYIDANGKAQLIEEHYFADEQLTRPISREELSVDLDGNLIYTATDGQSSPVYTSLEAPSGLKLIASIQGISGFENVDYEPEELANVKANIEQLEKAKQSYTQTLEQIKQQLFFTVINNHITQTNSLQPYNVNEESSSTKNSTSDSATIDEISEKELANLKKYVNSSIYYDSLSLSYTDFESQLKDIISQQEFSSMLDSITAEDRNTCLKNLLKKHYNFSSQDITIKEDYFPANPTLCDAQHASASLSISQYTAQYQNYQQSLAQAQTDLQKLYHQRSLLEQQVPVHYLYTQDGTIYGFGKTEPADDAPSGEIYRLILIADAYQNIISIAYKAPNDNRIESITDSAQNTLTFSYNNSGMLQSITDARDGQVTLGYTNDQLTSITHAGDAKVSYSYNPDGLLDKAVNADHIGAQFGYTNGKVTAINQISALQSITDGQLQPAVDGQYQTIADQAINITYNNYKSTTTTNAHGKSLTYLFDNTGKARTIYQSQTDPISNATCVQATEFNYQDDTLAEQITLLPYSQNLLANQCFDTSSIKTNHTAYPLLGLTTCGESPLLHTFYQCKTFHTATSADQIKLQLDTAALDALNATNPYCPHKSYILSGWAKADSAFVIMGEDEDFADYIKARKFELRAEIFYQNQSEPVTFAKPFDWRNTGWQYCALPITIDASKQVAAMTCYVDYSHNIGEISFTDLQLKEGDWQKSHTQTTEAGKITTQTSAHSKWQTQSEYDADGKLIRQTITNLHPASSGQQTEFVTTYQYTKGGKLLRSVDYNGIVKENVYNDKGQVIKSLTYHQDQPGEKLYEEHILGEQGQETATLNALGKQISTSEFVDGTGTVSASVNNSGTQTSYAYAPDGTLLQTAVTINGENNTNIYGYTLDYLTSLTHNDFSINYNYDHLGRVTDISVAGQQYLSKKYDQNQETTTLANGEVYVQDLNDDGNVLATTYNGETMSENIYDTYGNLVCTKDSEADQTTKIYLNNFGKAYKQQTLQGTSDYPQTAISTIENQYDKDHNNVVSSRVTIGNNVIKYQYEYDQTPDSKLQQLNIQNSYNQEVLTQALAYDKLGRTSSVLTNNNMLVKYKYLTSGDHTSSLVSKMSFNNSSDCLNYKYDDYGNITEIRHLNDLIARYKYDDLHRLIREDNVQLDKTCTYSYDAGGNITERREYNLTLVDNLELEDFIPFTYTYALTGWADQLICYNGKNFVYDSIGNPKVYKNNFLQFSHGRRLDKFNNIEYKYNANGIRISKKVDDVETKYIYNGTKLLQLTEENNTMTFRYGINGVAGFNLNGTEYTYKKNLQNDVIGIINADGIQIADYIYDAWGNFECKILSNNVIVVANSIQSQYTNTELDDLAIELNPFTYRSYIYDIETNLYYLNSRYYDPEIGRFINADDISVLAEGQNFINGLNLYSYCNNNPILYTDEGGEAWWHWLVGAAIIVIAAALTVVTAGGFAAGLGAIAGAAGFGATAGGAAGFFAAVAVGATVGGTIGLLNGGLSSAINGGSFWEGATDGFMWGSISGALSGAWGKISFGKVGSFGPNGKGNIFQVAGQSLISVGTYIAKTLSNNDHITIVGLLWTLFGGISGGLLNHTKFPIQVFVSGSVTVVDILIEYLKKLWDIPNNIILKMNNQRS